MRESLHPPLWIAGPIYLISAGRAAISSDRMIRRSAGLVPAEDGPITRGCTLCCSPRNGRVGTLPRANGARGRALARRPGPPWSRCDRRYLSQPPRRSIPLWRLTSKIHDNFTEQIGWPSDRDRRRHLHKPSWREIARRNLAGNYGEAGAIDFTGAYHLPEVICGTNIIGGGYGTPPPEANLVGFSAKERRTCRPGRAGRSCHESLAKRDERHPDIFVCRRMKKSWPEFSRTSSAFYRKPSSHESGHVKVLSERRSLTMLPLGTAKAEKSRFFSATAGLE